MGNLSQRAWASLELRPFPLPPSPAPPCEVDAQWPDGIREGEVVIAYPHPDRFPGAPEGFDRLVGRSFVYDDALLALARIASDDHEAAARVLAALVALQLPDGSWGFSFDPETSFYDRAYVRSGAVAFAVYALAKYVERYDSSLFLSAARRGGMWLLAQRDERSGLISAGRGWGDTSLPAPSGLLRFAVTEHQIDTWFAFSALASIDPDGPWREAARSLEEAILDRLWLADEGRFAQGWHDDELDRGSALDASGSWGALFLLALGRRDEARRSLDWVEREHGLGGGYRPYVSGPKTWFVEASIAVALAWHRLDPEDGRGARTLQRIELLARSHGLPLIYSTRWKPDFPMTPAAGPTLWYLMVEAELSGSPPLLWSEGADRSEVRP